VVSSHVVTIDERWKMQVRHGHDTSVECNDFMSCWLFGYADLAVVAKQHGKLVGLTLGATCAGSMLNFDASRWLAISAPARLRLLSWPQGLGGKERFVIFTPT